jgi:hypothetical protein
MIEQHQITVREKIHLAYSNLAMAHMAVEKCQPEYSRINYMVRAKLYKGLNSGKMNMRTLFDDEKLKIENGKTCNYCGSNEALALDHIFPRKYGGKDDSENLIFACRTCNSSKGKKDLMEWMNDKNQFLPLMIIRRYMKLMYKYCCDNNLLDKSISEMNGAELPFKIEFLPISFPSPQTLKL